MKRSLLLFVLAACGAELSADSLDFSVAPLRLALPEPAHEQYLPADSQVVGASVMTLRGFRFRDVGPGQVGETPSDNAPIRRSTVEYTFPVIQKVRGAVFYDTGFLSPGNYDFCFLKMVFGTGLGLRLDLIGPLRLDYGIPVPEEQFSGEDSYQPHLDAPGPGYREQLQRQFGP